MTSECNNWSTPVTIYLNTLFYTKPCLNVRKVSETMVVLMGPGWWAVIHSCSTPTAPLCQPISCFYIWQLSRTFLCYCGGTSHLVYRGHTHTGTRRPTNTHEPVMTLALTHIHTHQTAYFFLLALFSNTPLPRLPHSLPAERWGLFTAGGYSCWLNKWARAGS